MIGSSEVIGDRELSRVSSARTITGREAAFKKPLTADGGYCGFFIFPRIFLMNTLFCGESRDYRLRSGEFHLWKIVG